MEFKDSKETFEKAYGKYIDEDAAYSLVEEMKADPNFPKIIANLQVSDRDLYENAALFSSYLEDRSICLNCPGYDKCNKKPAQHYWMSIAKVGGMYVTISEPCEEQKKIDRVVNNYLFKDFDDEWLKCSVASLPRSDKKKDVGAAIKDAMNSNTKKWVYLQGESGSGKSFVTVAYTNWLASKGNEIAFIDVNKRIDELKGYLMKNSPLFSESFKALVDADVLVLDGIGNEFKSDYTREQIMRPLLSERSRANKLTIFTSQYSLADLKELYTVGKGTFRANAMQAESLIALIENNIVAPVRIKKGVESKL